MNTPTVMKEIPEAAVTPGDASACCHLGHPGLGNAYQSFCQWEGRNLGQNLRSWTPPMMSPEEQRCIASSVSLWHTMTIFYIKKIMYENQQGSG